MLQEGYILGVKKEGTRHSIRARITELIGKEETEHGPGRGHRGDEASSKRHRVRV